MLNLADFKSITLLSYLLFLTQISHAAAGRVSLKRAMGAKLVSVSAVSTGGYCDKSLSLTLTNNTEKEMNIDIDPALIFAPADTQCQYLVLLGNEQIVLAPAEKKSITLQTFCGKSYARSPYKGIKYTYLKQGDSGLIRTLDYVKKKTIDIGLAQRAVWTFTNGYCISTIYKHENPAMSEDFVKYVASVRKTKIPEYFTEYKLNNRANQPVIMTNQEKVYVNLHWGHEGYKHMYVSIYKENGELYKEISADQVIDKNGYRVAVEFDPRRDPKGVYKVQVHDNFKKIWQEKKVVVGADPGDML